MLRRVYTDDMGKKKKNTTRRQLTRGGRGSKSARTAMVPKKLVADLRKMIDESRQVVAQTVNSALVWLYWNIGKRIREDVLQNKRAGYGEEIVAALSRELTAEFGKGFGRRSLFRMMQFAEYFPDEKIVSALSTQLSWSHFVEILSLDDSLKREFYAEMCRIERWSVRTLRQKIDRLLFERTAVSKKSEELIAHDLEGLRDEDRLTPDLVFAFRIFSIFWDCPTRVTNAMSRTRSCASWNRSFWNWAATSRSSPARNG